MPKEDLTNSHREVLEQVEILLRRFHIPHTGKHTPGPWHVSADMVPAMKAKGMHACIRDANGWSIAYVTGPGRGSDHDDGVQADANARLMALGPLMYSVLCDVKGSGNFSLLARPLRMLILATLNKAEQ